MRAGCVLFSFLLSGFPTGRNTAVFDHLATETSRITSGLTHLAYSGKTRIRDRCDSRRTTSHAGGDKARADATHRSRAPSRILAGRRQGTNPGDRGAKRSNLSDRARAIFFSIPAISNLIDKAGFSSASPNVSGIRLCLGVAASIWVE